MKSKFYFGLIAIAAMTASCSSDVDKSADLQGNAIEFGTYVGRDAQSRASVVDLDGLKTSGFGVFAYYTAQAAYADGATANFMNNQQVTWDGTGSAWTYTPLKYWPNNPGDKVTFFAYAPYNVAGATLSPDAGTITFTVADAVANQKDLTVADAVKDQTKQTISGKVNFTFKHVLSRIGLNVEAMVDLVNSDPTGNTDNNTVNGSLDAATNITVTKVELIGKFDKEGVIDLTNSTWSDVATAGENVTYTWTDANFVSSVANNVTTTKQQLSDADDYAMIIPQDMSTSKIKFVVYYTVTTTDSADSKNNSVISNVITSDEFAFNFEQGKAYMFNLHLGMTSVKFDATVADWENGGETVVNVPINAN